LLILFDVCREVGLLAIFAEVLVMCLKRTAASTQLLLVQNDYQFV